MYFWVCLASVLAAALTLFSGFGLGTVLTPVFALFLPVETAIGATAVVHLANNVFKLVLVGRHADRAVVLKFGLPAAVAAVVGAMILHLLSDAAPVWVYSLRGREHQVTLVKLVIGALIVLFAVGELLPRVAQLAFHRKYLPLGGILSGFFGGLSGHQGALRSAFLIKCGLTKEAFIGTGVVAAVIVDGVRLPLYLASFGEAVRAHGGLIAAATGAAFAGSYIGARLMKKVTLRTVQVIVAVALVLIAVAMATGLI